MGKALFVTGVGTEVGKTYVSGLLARKLNAQYYKPVLSGAEYLDGKLVAMDALKVRQARGTGENAHDKVSYLFEEALSPHLASLRANVSIKEEKILADYKAAKNSAKYLVVEGAGGLICPIRWDQRPLFLVELIKEFKIPLLIVCDSGLGAINRALLSVEYARQKKLEIAGIVMNHFEFGDLICEDNLKMIEQISGIKVIDTLINGQEELRSSFEELASLFS